VGDVDHFYITKYICIYVHFSLPKEKHEMDVIQELARQSTFLQESYQNFVLAKTLKTALDKVHIFID